MNEQDYKEAVESKIKFGFFMDKETNSIVYIDVEKNIKFGYTFVFENEWESMKEGIEYMFQNFIDAYHNDSDDKLKKME